MRMRSQRQQPLAFFVCIVALTVACGRPAEQAPAPANSEQTTGGTTADRKYLLETVDDAAVVQLYADGFASLPLREKTLIWHLSQAAIAGRDIYYDQKHRDALEMRGVLEAIVAHPQGIDPATLAEIQRYTKLFWINNGPYNNLTARKFVLKMHARRRLPPPRRRRRRPAPRSRRRPANRSTRCWRGCSRCSSTRTSIRSSPTRRRARARTSCTASANNLYSGVSMADLKGFTENDTASTRGW